MSILSPGVKPPATGPPEQSRWHTPALREDFNESTQSHSDNTSPTTEQPPGQEGEPTPGREDDSTVDERNQSSLEKENPTMENPPGRENKATATDNTNDRAEQGQTPQEDNTNSTNKNESWNDKMKEMIKKREERMHKFL